MTRIRNIEEEKPPYKEKVIIFSKNFDHMLLAHLYNPSEDERIIGYWVNVATTQVRYDAKEYPFWAIYKEIKDLLTFYLTTVPTDIKSNKKDIEISRFDYMEFGK